MHVSATVAETFDGPIDEGIERPATRRRVPSAANATNPRTDQSSDVGAEAAAHAALRLIGDFPGQMGRLRAARIVGGYPVPHRDDDGERRIAGYAVQLDWPLREITRLVDALISGGLVSQTSGPRPVLVLTRSGYRAVEALEGARSLP